MLGINDFHGQLDTVKKINNKEAGGADYLATYLKERKKAKPEYTSRTRWRYCRS